MSKISEHLLKTRWIADHVGWNELVTITGVSHVKCWSYKSAHDIGRNCTLPEHWVSRPWKLQ